MSDVAVLIPSVDSFADCHQAALACLAKYWPDCPWPIITTSTTKWWGPLCLKINPDQGWVGNLKAALGIMETREFVCLFLEDMLLCRPVDTAACEIAANAMQMIPILGAIRLGQGGEQTSPLGDLRFTSDGEVDMHSPGFNCFSRVTLDSPYRVSTSPTLWRVSYLRKILANCGMTAWDFETRGTTLSRTLPEEIWVQACHETERAFRCYYTAITRGKWDRNAVEWLKRDLGLEVDVSRGFMEAR